MNSVVAFCMGLLIGTFISFVLFAVLNSGGGNNDY